MRGPRRSQGRVEQAGLGHSNAARDVAAGGRKKGGGAGADCECLFSAMRRARWLVHAVSCGGKARVVACV
jgi:hypothetical protein